jgi:integrase
MSSREQFKSWLAPSFERFVSLHRACGSQYTSAARILTAFDRFLVERVPLPPLRNCDLGEFLARLDHLTDRGRDNVFGVVWPALEFAIAHQDPVEPLPPRPRAAPRWQRLRPPRILSTTEGAAVVAAARQLTPTDSLRPATAATLIGLLLATGIRIGEALALDVGDLDESSGLLTVRRGKFGKTRILPLRDSTLAALVDYLADPRRPVGRETTAPLFVSLRGRRLCYPGAAVAFRVACLRAGLDATRLPRPHDLRHTFAVSRVAAWYTEHRDLEVLLPALSTYLGHISVESTRCYLQANGVLLEQASQRFETLTVDLDRDAP